MRMCTVLNWSKMRSPIVGVGGVGGSCMDSDEAASEAVQYPLELFVITSAWEPNLHSCNRDYWGIKS